MKFRVAEIWGLLANLTLPILIVGIIGAAPNAVADSLDEVVVTARKIAEPLADVPLSIQVITREELERARIDGLQTLAGYVPGLYVEPMWGGTNAAPTLRGQSHPGPGGNTVGVFVDGVLQANVSGDDAAMFDLERVEVVKGPQSALYGDSTFAGAINFVTRRPTAELQSEVTLSAGSNAYRTLLASVSGPLGPPGLLGRAAFVDREFDGTGVNVADPRRNLGGYHKWGASLASEYTWDGNWRASGDVRLTNDRSGQPATSTLFASGYNCGSRDAKTGYWSFYCGDIPRARRYDLTPSIPDSVTRTLQTSARVEWRQERFSFDSLSAYYRSSSQIYQDWDGTSAGEVMGVCTVGVNCDMTDAAVNRLVNVNQVALSTDLIEQITQEFRGRHHGARLDWMLGAQIVKNSEHSGDGLAVGPVALGADEELTALMPQAPHLVGPVSALNGLVLSDPNRVQDFDSDFIDIRSTLTTVFGALDYRLTSQVDLHAELRQGLGAFSVTAPRVSVDYRTDAGLIWLSVARGETAGGSNGVPTLIPSEREFGPESEWTYELGFRGALWSEKVNLSATSFYNDWRNAQIPGPSNTPGYFNSVIRNVRGITTPGAELTADIKITRSLSTVLGYTYDDPRFKSGSEDYGGTRFCGVTAGNTTSNFCTLGRSRVVTPGSAFLVPYVDGNALQRAPQQQWTAALTFEPPHALRSPYWFMRGSIEHQGRVFVRPIDGAYDGEHTLLDARLGLARVPWSVELWGSNLTDQNYIRAVASRPRFYFPTVVQPQDLIYGDGRRFGIDLRLRF